MIFIVLICILSILCICDWVKPGCQTWHAYWTKISNELWIFVTVYEETFGFNWVNIHVYFSDKSPTFTSDPSIWLVPISRFVSVVVISSTNVMVGQSICRSFIITKNRIMADLVSRDTPPTTWHHTDVILPILTLLQMRLGKLPLSICSPDILRSLYNGFETVSRARSSP